MCTEYRVINARLSCHDEPSADQPCHSCHSSNRRVFCNLAKPIDMDTTYYVDRGDQLHWRNAAHIICHQWLFICRVFQYDWSHCHDYFLCPDYIDESGPGDRVQSTTDRNLCGDLRIMFKVINCRCSNWLSHGNLLFTGHLHRNRCRFRCENQSRGWQPRHMCQGMNPT